MAKKKLTMKEIRELAKNRDNNNRQDFKNSDIYPFWLMNPGDEAKIRFLPDKNKDNPLPFIEKLEHKLSINGNTRKIACPKMYGHECAICDKSKEYYDVNDEENGKFYYRDKMHLARAVILEDPIPLKENEDPRVGQTKTLQLGFQLYEKIMDQLGSFFDDDDPLPWDLEEGFNFTIKPVEQGKYKKYDLASSFDRKPSEIPEEYLENIEIIDLRTLLPEEVDYDKSNEFLHQHLSGGVDDDPDSLESKKKNSSSGSGKRSALSRLKGEANDDDDDDDDDVELDEDEKEELSSTIEEAKNSSDEDDEDDDDDDEDDDDDDDDDEALKAIIERRKKKRKK